MKINNFYCSINIKYRDTYPEILQFNTNYDNSDRLEVTYPYGIITPKESLAISAFSRTIIEAFEKLQQQIDNVNKELKLEEYAPKCEVEEQSNEAMEHGVEQ